jgi:hypothetical protein
MRWIVAHMKWIMLVAGALTCTMFYGAVAPEAALQGTFGDTLQGPVANVVVRNWAVLIGLMGVMLIYGAFHVHVRPLVLVVAGLSKIVFVVLILTAGQSFLMYQAGIAVVSDAIQVLLFVWYLIGSRRTATLAGA